MKVFPEFFNSIRTTLSRYLPPVYIVHEDFNKEGVDGRVIAYIDRLSYVAEQYKTLRTNLYSLSPENPIKTVVITSSQPWEGKTVTCCNLAITISYDKEKKVILIDADMRKPAIHSFFGLPNEPGFSDLLSGKVSLEKFTTKPAIGDLFIIPAGSPIDDPAEILSSTNVDPLIKKIKSAFDYAIFDSPPVLEFTDASILGSLCDAVILVVKAASTQEQAIQEALNLLSEAQATPKACVLTNVVHLLDSRYHFYKYKQKIRSTAEKEP
ncbi:MAG: CpsD/CapB family tyrosine-protein kinase [Candidatus Omnitrophica bacterium]|nr:CpsD/CapB family tyrosine-protein kinase [Candidatus Omnitrophota bacterium]MCM8791327.1 CpsD/CapB family tyrosine-protein kinase [Candidatus Omnitrophota bacterium]